MYIKMYRNKDILKQLKTKKQKQNRLKNTNQDLVINEDDISFEWDIKVGDEVEWNKNVREWFYDKVYYMIRYKIEDEYDDLVEQYKMSIE